MRINRRLMLLLIIIALAKSDSRYQVVFDNQTLTIAAVEDLSEALYIMQNSTGLPPYKVKFFNEDILSTLPREIGRETKRLPFNRECSYRSGSK